MTWTGTSQTPWIPATPYTVPDKAGLPGLHIEPLVPSSYLWENDQLLARNLQQELTIARLQERINTLVAQANDRVADIVNLNRDLNATREQSERKQKLIDAFGIENDRLAAENDDLQDELAQIADIVDWEEGDDEEPLEDTNSYGEQIPPGPTLVQAVEAAVESAKRRATERDIEKAYEDGRLFGRKQMNSISDDERKALQATIDGQSATIKMYKDAADRNQQASHDLATIKRILTKP